MSQRIYRSHEAPKREGLSTNELWKGEDRGLVTCWEAGLEMRKKDPELAKRAENGELPVLAWKGGVEKPAKKSRKYGTLYYLAQWQGLRGEDLDIDLSQEPELVCSKTGVRVVYTLDPSKYGSS